MTVEKFIKGRLILLQEPNHIRRMIKLIELHDDSENAGEASIEVVETRFKQINHLYQYPLSNKLYQFKIGRRKLKPITDAKKIQGGKFIDISETVKNDEIKSLECLPELLALLYKESSTKRTKLTFEQKVEYMKQADIKKAYAVVVFFCRVMENLLPSITTYLEETVKDLTTGNDLVRNGAGLQR